MTNYKNSRAFLFGVYLTVILVVIMAASPTALNWITQIKNGPVFDVRSFGAVSDGLTDSTAKVQNAINAACAAGGGRVLFVGGPYKISTVNVACSNIILDGDSGSAFYGTSTRTLVLSTASGQNAINFTGSGLTTVGNRISGISIDGSAVLGTMAFAVSVTNQQGFHFDRLSAYSVANGIDFFECLQCVGETSDILGLLPSTGVGIRQWGVPSQLDLSRITINGTNLPCGVLCEPFAGIEVQDSYEIKIHHSDIYHSGTGILFDPGLNQLVQYAEVDHTYADQNSASNVTLATTDSTALLQSVILTDVWASSGAHGVLLAGGPGIINGVAIHGGRMYHNYFGGVDLNAGTNITIDGSRITGNTLQQNGFATWSGATVTYSSGDQFGMLMAGHPIVLGGSSFNIQSVGVPATTLTLTASAGTQATPTAYSFGNGPGCGIGITAGVSHVQIHGVVSGTIDAVNVTSTPNSQEYGICALSTGNDYLDISGNTVWTNIAAGGILNLSTATHNLIHDNGGYNPIGPATYTCTGSPCTVPIGPTQTQVYVLGGAISNITLNGVSFAASTNQWFMAPPNSALVVTYSSVPAVALNVF